MGEEGRGWGREGCGIAVSECEGLSVSVRVRLRVAILF